MQVYDYTNLIWTFSSNSNGGQYLKSEYIKNGVKYYLKLSDYLYGSFNSHESVLEVIASRLGSCLGLPVLKYTGCMANIMLDGKLFTTYVSKSVNYCNRRQTAMPLVAYYNINKLPMELPIEFCRRYNMSTYVDKMLIFDYLIMNTDRHGKNIEMLVDNSNVEPAPIFDNGRCLTYDRGNNINNILQYDYKAPGQGNNFIGGLNLENNLRYVSKVYKLPRLTNEVKKKIFHGLHGVLDKRHIELIWTALGYRYNNLLKKGVIA